MVFFFFLSGNNSSFPTSALGCTKICVLFTSSGCRVNFYTTLCMRRYHLVWAMNSGRRLLSRYVVPIWNTSIHCFFLLKIYKCTLPPFVWPKCCLNDKTPWRTSIQVRKISSTVYMNNHDSDWMVRAIKNPNALLLGIFIRVYKKEKKTVICYFLSLWWVTYFTNFCIFKIVSTCILGGLVCGGGLCVFLVGAGVCAWGRGSMFRVVWLLCIFVQLLHLFVYFNMSLLARLISIFLKFIFCYFLNVCNICVFMCNI